MFTLVVVVVVVVVDNLVLIIYNFLILSIIIKREPSKIINETDKVFLFADLKLTFF